MTSGRGSAAVRHAPQEVLAVQRPLLDETGLARDPVAIRSTRLGPVAERDATRHLLGRGRDADHESQRSQEGALLEHRGRVRPRRSSSSGGTRTPAAQAFTDVLADSRRTRRRWLYSTSQGDPMVTRGLLLTLVCVASLGELAANRVACQGGARRQGRLAAMARAGSHGSVEGVRRCSGEWPSAGPALLWSAANLGAGYGSLAVSGDRIFVQGTRARTQHRGDAEPRGWQGALVEGARARGRQRSRTRAERHADGGRRSCLRADGERRPCLPAGQGRHVGVAAEHPQGLRRPEHSMADQRIAAGRRQSADCHAGRTRTPAWSRSTR